MSFLVLFASAALLQTATENEALARWQECVDARTVKLTEDIGQTHYTPNRSRLVDAIARVAVAQCQHLWGWELKSVDKEREQKAARKRAGVTAEALFRNYDLEAL